MTAALESSTDLAQLLASRICHDLISPVAAVGNALELLEEGEELCQDSLALLKTGAKIAAAKLTFMRAAFGAGKVLPEQMSFKDLETIFNAFLQEGKISHRFSGDSEKVFNREEGRVLLNMILALSEALPRGGNLTITAEADNFTLTAEGDKVIFPEDKAAILTDSAAVAEEPRFVGCYFLRLAVEKAGKSLKFNRDPENNRVSLAFS